MNKDIIREIGIKKEVGNINLFVSFLSERFPNESDRISSYFEEWADRFNSGNPQRSMDIKSLKIYNKLHQEEMANLLGGGRK